MYDQVGCMVFWQSQKIWYFHCHTPEAGGQVWHFGHSIWRPNPKSQFYNPGRGKCFLFSIREEHRFGQMSLSLFYICDNSLKWVCYHQRQNLGLPAIICVQMYFPDFSDRRDEKTGQCA